MNTGKNTSNHSDHNSTGSAGSSNALRAESVSGGQEIVSYASNRCIDVKAGSSASGTRLLIWDCKNAAWQKWSFVNGTIRSLGMCMNAAGASSDGTPIEIANCDGRSSEMFKLNSSHDIVRSGTSECVDVTGAKTTNATLLQLWRCKGSSNQKWHTG